MIHITECPRDAMQGIKPFIPTKDKIRWLNALLKVGYDILDFGSFVSPKAIPQLRDTPEIVDQLDLDTPTKLLAIIPNLKGAEAACKHNAVTYLGYPHSISEEFLHRNIKSSVEESRNRLQDIQEHAVSKNKIVYAYISMCFGNIYGEVWNTDIILHEIGLLKEIGIENIALADTSGIGSPETIGRVFQLVKQHFPDLHFSLHLHTTPGTWYSKVEAAYKNGCTHFESVMNGMGGCPLAASNMVGNLDTSFLLEFLEKNRIQHSLLLRQYKKAQNIAIELFKNGNYST